MAYTEPRTWVANEIVTAAYLNGVRDILNLTAPALAQAKGDLIAGASANAPTRVPVGADGTMLMVDSACAGGVKWGTYTGAYIVGRSNSVSMVDTNSTSFVNVNSQTSSASVVLSGLSAQYVRVTVIGRGAQPNPRDAVYLSATCNGTSIGDTTGNAGLAMVNVGPSGHGNAEFCLFGTSLIGPMSDAASFQAQFRSSNPAYTVTVRDVVLTAIAFPAG